MASSHAASESLAKNRQYIEFDIAPYLTLMHFSTFLAWSGVELKVSKLQISIDTCQFELAKVRIQLVDSAAYHGLLTLTNA